MMKNFKNIDINNENIFLFYKMCYILFVVFRKLRIIVAKSAFFTYFCTFSVLKNAVRKKRAWQIFFLCKMMLYRAKIQIFRKI